MIRRQGQRHAQARAVRAGNGGDVDAVQVGDESG